MKRALILVFVVFSAVLYAGEGCPFCSKQILDYQSFYEGDKVVGLYTHKPVNAGHCLIIPKRHVERYEDLTAEELAEITATIKKVNTAVSAAFETSRYLLVQKNGKEVGQSVPHVHFHYIPAKADNKSAIVFWLRLWLGEFNDPISHEEMAAAIAKIKAAWPSN